MNYTILSIRVVDEIIMTQVEYDFDGAKVNVEVAHFMPENQSAIELGITNRGETEKRKLDAIAFNNQLASEIKTDLGIPDAPLVTPEEPII